ncbi:MFS transporter [Conexivisphaera calida]|uniref:Niacin transporter NiaP n=1 Tax=Conexivisphaera calida TaxID=1874277 RepID=A0A4P2VBT5_9ARCH|nr:MFS transporter [Conexivisphaera calida]BBE41996.1 Niacin transporter NiaP [Conexivisphaera calida]
MGTIVPQKGISRTRLLLAGGIGWLFDAMDVLLLSYVLAYLRVHYGWATVDEAYVMLANNVGLLVGAMVFGRLADSFGRRRAFMTTLLVYSVMAAAMGFFTSPLPLMVVRFLMGLGLGGELPVVSTLVSELSRPEQRGTNVVLLESFWSYGTIAAGVLASFVLPITGYSMLMWALAATALYAVVIRRGIPESRHTAERPSFRSLLGSEHRRLFPAWVAWFAIAFGYYGFALWVPSVLVGRGFPLLESFEYFLVMTILQVPGYFSAAYLVERIGRRPTFISYMVISAASAIGFSFASSALLLVIFGGALNFFNVGAWGVIYAYTPELFGDANRASATGSCTSMARVGMILGPYVPALIAFGASLWTFAALWLVGAAAVILLPETASGIRTGTVDVR